MMVSLPSGVIDARRDARRRAATASRGRDGRNGSATPARRRSAAAPRTRCPGSLTRLGPAKLTRRRALRPHRIDQDVEARRSGSAGSRGRQRKCARPRPRRAPAAGRHRATAPRPAISPWCRAVTIDEPAQQVAHGSSAACRAGRRSARRRNDRRPDRRNSATSRRVQYSLAVPARHGSQQGEIARRRVAGAGFIWHIIARKRPWWLHATRPSP